MAFIPAFNPVQLYLKAKCTTFTTDLSFFQMDLTQIVAQVNPKCISRNLFFFFFPRLGRQESDCILKSRTDFRNFRFNSLVLNFWSCPHSSIGRESACSAGDWGSLPGSGRSPGEGDGNPLQYSCLENPMEKPF